MLSLCVFRRANILVNFFYNFLKTKSFWATATCARVTIIMRGVGQGGNARTNTMYRLL